MIFIVKIKLALPSARKKILKLKQRNFSDGQEGWACTTTHDVWKKTCIDEEEDIAHEHRKLYKEVKKTDRN